MTDHESLERVLRHVRATRGWHLDAAGRLRREARQGTGAITCCPISSLDRQGPAFYAQVAADHGISLGASVAIVCAADNPRERVSRQLRERLLRAAGVPEGK